MSRGFVFKRLLFAHQIVLIVTGPAGYFAAVDFHNSCCKVLQKCPVMSNEQHTAAKTPDGMFKPVDGCYVEMVGWLIKQQQFGLAD